MASDLVVQAGIENNVLIGKHILQTTGDLRNDASPIVVGVSCDKKTGSRIDQRYATGAAGITVTDELSPVHSLYLESRSITRSEASNPTGGLYLFHITGNLGGLVIHQPAKGSGNSPAEIRGFDQPSVQREFESPPDHRRCIAGLCTHAADRIDLEIYRLTAASIIVVIDIKTEAVLEKFQFAPRLIGSNEGAFQRWFWHRTRGAHQEVAIPLILAGAIGRIVLVNIQGKGLASPGAVYFCKRKPGWQGLNQFGWNKGYPGRRMEQAVIALRQRRYPVFTNSPCGADKTLVFKISRSKEGVDTGFQLIIRDRRLGLGIGNGIIIRDIQAIAGLCPQILAGVCIYVTTGQNIKSKILKESMIIRSEQLIVQLVLITLPGHVTGQLAGLRTAFFHQGRGNIFLPAIVLVFSNRCLHSKTVEKIKFKIGIPVQPVATLLQTKIVLVGIEIIPVVPGEKPGRIGGIITIRIMRPVPGSQRTGRCHKPPELLHELHIQVPVIPLSEITGGSVSITITIFTVDHLCVIRNIRAGSDKLVQV